MPRECTGTRVLVALLGLALGGCQSSRVQAKEKPGASEEVPEGRVIFETAEPAVSLAAAVTTAQQSVPGGRVLRAELKETQGATTFCILVAVGDGARELTLDVATGQVLATDDKKLDPDSSALLARIARDPKSAACTAVKAIDAALAQARDSWACSLTMGGEEGKLGYAVGTVEGKRMRIAMVSAADGSVGEKKLFEIRGLGATGYEELSQAPPISLARAIAIAGKRASGERFLHAELGRDDGRADCLVVFWVAESLHAFSVDAESGALLIDGREEAPAEYGAQLRKAAEHPAASIETSRAIEIAIAARPGTWARLIDLEIDSDPPVYSVEIVAGEDVRYVRIGAVDGKVLSVRTEAETSDESETDG